MHFALSRLPQNSLNILMPLRFRISLTDLDHEQLILTHVRGQLSQTLPAAASHPHQQRMPSRLLQNAANPRHVLDREPEHDQMHRPLIHLVILVQLVLHKPLEHIHVAHLQVALGLVLRVAKVAEHERPQVVLGDTAQALDVQIGQHRVEVLAQAGLGDLDGVLVEPLAVVVVHQAVVVDPVDLVDPEALHGVDVLAALGVAQANALNDPGEVAQVEDVVGLGGRGQKVLHGAFVDGQGGGDDLGDDLLEGVVKVLGRDVPIQDLGEDGGHGGVIELVDGDEEGTGCSNRKKLKRSKEAKKCRLFFQVIRKRRECNSNFDSANEEYDVRREGRCLKMICFLIKGQLYFFCFILVSTC